MRKLILITSTFFVFILLLSMVSAGEIWKFDNFENKYKVWKSAKCNVEKSKSCPSEFGWQGKSLTFDFNLNQKTSDTMIFNLVSGYHITSVPVDIYVNNKKIAENKKIGLIGPYSFEFPSSLLKEGKKNTVKIIVKDIKVGYGKPAAGFILSSVSLSNK